MEGSSLRKLTRSFFRQVTSHELLHQFMRKHDIAAEMGVDENSSCQRIGEAWFENIHGKKEYAEAQLCLEFVNDLGREEGRLVLWRYIERDKVLLDSIPDYKDIPPPRLALTFYLANPDRFLTAHRIYEIEKSGTMRMWIADEPVDCSPSKQEVEAFVDELRRKLKNSGLGDRVKPEVDIPHPDKWVLCLPHETMAKPDEEFKDSEMEIEARERRPVYELVLIYHPTNGLLKIRAGRGKKKVQIVADCFATTILGREPDFFSPCDAIDFGPLKAGTCDFSPVASDLFEWAMPIEVSYIDVSHSGVLTTVRVEAPVKGGTSALEVIKDKGVDLTQLEVRSLSIFFEYAKELRQRTVELRPNSGLRLEDSPRDANIQDALERWGFINFEADQDA